MSQFEPRTDDPHVNKSIQPKLKMNILASETSSVRASTDAWQTILKAAFRSPEELAAELQLPTSMAITARGAHDQFRLFAPQPFVDLMERGRTDDPLLLQIWPAPAELQIHPDEKPDPVGDAQAHVMPGVLQKYSGRALLVLTGACAVHCRYCFRRNWSYDESPGSLVQWEPSLAAIEADPSIHEVILSGGDPFMWDDEKLARLVERIEQMQHVSRLRIHTRMPVVLPQRVTPELLSALSTSSLRTVVVVHANHHRELSQLVQQAMERMAAQGFTLLNQSVLLAGVNDTANELVQLSERLIECSVLPYYLHQLDRVTGSSHFDVSIDRGRALIAEMRRRLPGYLVPRYVRETPGEQAKSVIA